MRGSRISASMSALGHERRFDDVRAMSAHPPISSAQQTCRDGRKVTITTFRLIGMSDQDREPYCVIGHRDSDSLRCRD
jgi:hypothetical protein